MILQSLNQFFERISGEEEYNLPQPGYSTQNVTFYIVLQPDGSLLNIEDARETITETTKSGKTKTIYRPRQLLVPGDSKPPGQGIAPCTLWDNTAYLLGYKKPDKDPEKAAREASRAKESFAASRAHHLQLESAIKHPAFSVVCRFFENWTPDQAEAWKEKLDDFAATGFGVFRVLPERNFVHALPEFKTWWNSTKAESENSDPVSAPCLVTGETLPIARLHDPAIKGVNGAAPGGAKLASFNLKAFESYKKEQSFNSPVSSKVAFQYCNALNALLNGPQSERHRVVIGDTTTVFWTEKRTNTESIFAAFLTGQVESDSTAKDTLSEDQALHQRLHGFLNILRKGGGSSIEELGDNPNSRFYILGLSGNVTRLSVRFWHVSTVAEMVDRLRAHYDALCLKRSFDNEPEFPAPIRLLDQTARERKAISPLLGGQLMQAILHGTSYPMSLYRGVLNRIRANDPVSYLKAAIIKAILTRNFNQSIEMSLNTKRTEPAYLLGRLFAALEKTQEDALGKVNAGLRERFYSSASATPGAVFPRILRTYTHHLAKLEGGRKINRERLIQAIHTPLDGYPNHLTLEEQGLFAIGYYHQRQDFFTSNKDEEKPSSEN